MDLNPHVQGLEVRIDSAVRSAVGSQKLPVWEFNTRREGRSSMFNFRVDYALSTGNVAIFGIPESLFDPLLRLTHLESFPFHPILRDTPVQVEGRNQVANQLGMSGNSLEET